MKLEKALGIAQVVLVIGFVLAAIFISQALKSSYKPPITGNTEQRFVSVETKRLLPETYKVQVRTSGIVVAKTNIAAVPQVSGRVEFVDNSFFQGGRFRAGQELFRIDKSDFQLNLNKSKAEVERAEANLALAEAEVESATYNWKQNNGSKPIPALVAKEPQFLRAKADLNSALANLAAAQLQLERTSFRFPFSGRVVLSDVAVGQYVAAGQSYGRVFDLSQLEINASLNDIQLKWLLSVGSPNIVISYSLLGDDYTVPGTYVGGASTFDSSTRFASVNFKFLEENSEIIPGIFVNIDIQGKQLHDVFKVPASAVQTDGTIWLEKNAALKSWKPEVIYRSDDSLIVRANNEHVTVVTSRIAGAFDGMSVVPVTTEIDDND